MPQAKFSVEEAQVGFLNNYRKYGFKDKSSMVRTALDRLMKDLERESLKESADLYAEIYRDDPELRELTDAAISGWPE